jgi:TonB family protein
VLPKTKETAGLTTPTPKDELPSSVPTGHLSEDRPRAGAGCVAIPLRVEGSQEATDPGQPSKPFQETTRTMIVFPLGGVLRLAAKVVRGQLVTVTNLNTRHRMLCRIVKVRDYPNMKAYVDFEFTQPAPAFWGLSFHPEAAAPPTVSAPSSWGIQPTILAPKTNPPVAAEPAAESVLHNTADSLQDSAARSISPAIFSEHSHLLAASLADPGMPEESARTNKSNPVRRVGFVAAALLVVAASAWFLLPRDAATSAPSSTQGASPGGSALAGEVQSDGAASTVMTVTATLPSYSPENTVEPPPTLAPNGNNQTLTSANAQKEQANKQNRRAGLPAITLTAPSVAPGQTTNQSTELPPEPTGKEEGVAPSGENRTGGIFGDASKGERLPPPPPPPPPAENRAPIRPGGEATLAHLVSSVPPAYPSGAKLLHIQGDVRILASIDEDGNVTEMKVLSGAMQLQDAAMGAVRKWKYQPAKLNGKPVAAQITVIVRFQLGP